MANTCSFFPIDFVKGFDSLLIEDGMSPLNFSSWWRENSARAKVSVSSTLSWMLGRRLHFSAARSSVGCSSLATWSSSSAIISRLIAELLMPANPSMAATMDRQDCNRSIQGMDGTKWDRNGSAARRRGQRRRDSSGGGGIVPRAAKFAALMA